MFISAKLNV